MSILLLTCTITAVSFLPFCVQEPLPDHLSAVWWILLSGIGNVFVGFLLYTWLIQNAGVTYTATYSYLVPPVALTMGYFFHNEPIYLISMIAVAIILFGVWPVLHEQQNQDELTMIIQE